jgi:hypothetical protein
VAIEVCSFGRDGIDDDSSCPKLPATSHTASKRVHQQVAAERLSVLRAIECQTSKQHDGDRIWHPAPQPRGRALMPDSAHRQGVVADYLPIAAKHVRGGCATSESHSRRQAQPAVERLDTAVEAVKAMRIGERLYGTERTGAQRAGIGLCPRA